MISWVGWASQNQEHWLMGCMDETELSPIYICIYHPRLLFLNYDGEHTFSFRKVRESFLYSFDATSSFQTCLVYKHGYTVDAVFIKYQNKLSFGWVWEAEFEGASRSDLRKCVERDDPIWSDVFVFPTRTLSSSHGNDALPVGNYVTGENSEELSAHCAICVLNVILLK